MVENVPLGSAARALNILYNHRTQGRGVERVHILGVADAWRAQGHRVDIASPPGVRVEETEDPQRLESPRMTGNVLGRLARSLPNFAFEAMELAYNLWAAPALLRRHRERRYDFVYERYAYLNVAGFLTAKMHGVPLVLEVNFTSATDLVRKRTRLAKTLERGFERLLFRRAQAIVVVSSRLRDLLVAAGVEQEKIAVLPNAADPTKFGPNMDQPKLREALGLGGRRVVGFVGHFYRWHGVHLLLETFEGVRHRVPDIAYLLVGDGPVRGEVEAQIQRLGWQKDVVLSGSVPHGSVPDYVSLFDVAVMPNSNDYGSPMKIAEYLAMGKPVVAPRLAPIEDMVEHASTGLLFEPGEAEDLERVLIDLFSDDDRRKRMSEAARREVETRLNWSYVADQIYALVGRRVDCLKRTRNTPW